MHSRRPTPASEHWRPRTAGLWSWTLLVVGGLLTAACGAAPSAEPTSAFDTGDPRVFAYTSPARTFRTNAFTIEGPDGLILVDTGFLPADGLRALERAEQATGKRVVLAVVLHANPDKFNGTAALQARGVRVITSSQVAQLIPHVHTIRQRSFADRYPGEYPAEPAEPESFGDTTTTLRVAGTELTLHVLGAGCSDAHVALEWEGHLFVGDLIAHRNHSWLELGLVDEWLARLDELQALSPVHVHPGRGASGGPELLVAERSYLEQVVAIVRARGADVPLSDADRAGLRTEVERAFPGYGFGVFLEIGLPAVAAGQQR